MFVGLWLLRTREPQLRTLLLAGSVASYAILLWARPGSLWLSDAGVLLVAIAGAFMLGSLLKNKGAVVTFCVAAAVADILSFSGGLTSPPAGSVSREQRGASVLGRFQSN